MTKTSHEKLVEYQFMSNLDSSDDSKEDRNKSHQKRQRVYNCRVRRIRMSYQNCQPLQIRIGR